MTAPGHAPGHAGAVCCDLDGVVWRGEEVIPGGAAAVARLRAAGWRVVFVTNNSGATAAEHCLHLARCGIEASADDLVTSAGVAAGTLAAELGGGARVLACAGDGVVEALAAAGLEPVSARSVDATAVAAVVVGWHDDFDFAELVVTADVIRGGARFIATNLDPTYPAAGGRLLPGNGAIVAAVATASGCEPTVMGKPHAPMATAVRALVGPAPGVMVGDRLSTDGAFAAVLGWPFGLVLSGVGGADGSEALADPPPAFVTADLAAFAERLLTEGLPTTPA